MTKHFDDVISLFSGKFKSSKLLLPILTAVGAWGGLPEGPRSFKMVTQNKIFQYFFLWILIMQGGGGADMDLSLIAVAAVFIITEIVIAIENSVMGPPVKE